MRIGVLEFHQSPSDSPKHFITGAKARRLVHDLQIAAERSKDTIQLVIEKSWSYIKAWLSSTREQQKATLERERYATECAQKYEAQWQNPNGAEYGFSRWPSKDLRNQAYC